MKIVVLVKHAPGASAKPSFAADHTTDRVRVDGGLSAIDAYAVEQALRLAESGPGAEVTFVTMGPARAIEALHKALAMGGDRAVHVLDDALHGSDAPATSLVLARAIQRAGFDLVICGAASSDGGMSVVPAMLAERLRVAQITFADQLTVSAGVVRVRRAGDAATDEVDAPLPAVVSVTDQTGPVRYPALKRIMSLRTRPVETWNLADLGVDRGLVGLPAAWTRVERVDRRPPRQAGTIVTDDGHGAARLIEFLVARRCI